jgi:hypothetical protein
MRCQIGLSNSISGNTASDFTLHLDSRNRKIVGMECWARVQVEGVPSCNPAIMNVRTPNRVLEPWCRSDRREACDR